jgi:hypothetical protein
MSVERRPFKLNYQSMEIQLGIKPTINRQTRPRDVPGTEFREKLNLEGRRRSKSMHRARREAADVMKNQ